MSAKGTSEEPLLDRDINIGDAEPGIKNIQYAVEDSLISPSRFKAKRNLAVMSAFSLLAYLLVAVLVYVPFPNYYSGVETNRWVDALYFSVVSLATVGYGDVVPRSPLSKLLACILVFSGIVFVATILNAAGSSILDRQEDLLCKQFENAQDSESEPSNGISEEHLIQQMRIKIAFAIGTIVAMLALGILVLMLVEGLHFLDALYCACITVTTVGYGDIGFQTLWGRLFAVFWILASTLSVAWALGTLVQAQLQERQQALAKWRIHRQLNREEQSRADIDKNGELSFPEFAIFKLKEMGLASNDVMEELKGEFEVQQKLGLLAGASKPGD